MLGALAAAHDAGLIHRDVKSSNILLDRWSGEGPRIQGSEGPSETPGRHESPIRNQQSEIPEPRTPNPEPFVKLADFGLARMLSAETRVTLGDSILGTPEYMSPEQARGDENIDHRTDLYSAGVVLYEMLTGRTPFRADTPTAVIHQILHTEPSDPRTLDKDADPHLSSLALRLLGKSPEDRFGSASEALTALDADQRIRSLEKRRRARRQLALGLVALALVAGAVWLLGRFGARPDGAPPAPEARGPIAKVWIVPPHHPDYEQFKTSVLVRYGDDPTRYVFHEFPPESLVVTAVQLLDQDGAGNQAVAVGTRMPVEGCNVFVFDAPGNEIWRMDLSNHPSVEKWPDCEHPGCWACYALAAADLDGEAGDELIAVATDQNSYPTRISIIDPRAGEIVSTYWHMGQLAAVYIQPDFLGPGRPAIIAWGYQNKLDGFGLPYPPRPYVCQSGEDQPRTDYDIVTAAMILDPADMDGLGPPRSRRIAIEPARPHAYAFLDMPYSVPCGTYVPEGQVERVPPESLMVGSIDRIQPVPRTVATVDGPWLKVDIGRLVPGAAILTVDRNLSVVGVEPVSGAPVAEDEAYWRARWRPIIRNRRYVDR